MNRETCQGCPIEDCRIELDGLCNKCDDIEEWLADHDKQIRDEVIDEFISKSDIEISESVIWNMIVSGRNKDASDLSDELVDYFSEVIRLVAEQMKGDDK